VGFDDLPLSSLVTPALTTIRQDTYEKGAMAVRLIDQAYAGKRSEGAVVRLPVQLVVRQSTASPEE
ncbi:MAG: substrate-binding domain-containing protein, partial [Mycobacterium leprae]